MEKVLDDFPLADADRCVACGLCLPHCPTYRLYRNEAESPRGRIAIMQGMATGQLHAEPVALQHLDHCLGCRNCEAVCPARVPYGSLLDALRASPAARARMSGWHDPLRIARNLSDPRRRRRLQRWLRMYRKSGAQWLLRRSGLLRGALALLDGNVAPDPVHPRGEHHAPVGELRGRVALFTGCSGAVHGDGPVDAAIKMLTRLGYHVQLPPTQGCCGALQQHYGDPGAARQLLQSNLAAFGDERLDAVLSLASGCGAMLAEYHRLSEDPRAARLSGLHSDVTAFLLREPWPELPVLQALREPVAVHEPCSLRNVLKGSGLTGTLIERIPGAKVTVINSATDCCGAAGLYGALHPQVAAALGDRAATTLQESGARILVSANPGCALHIATMARRRGVPVTVMHPVELLARQLRTGSSDE